MPDDPHLPTGTGRILVVLRPSSDLGVAESRVRLRPLLETPGVAPFGFGAEPRWYVAEPPGGAANPWDAAHDRLAGQLGVAPDDVLFAEPDLVHRIYPVAAGEDVPEHGFTLGANCGEILQDGGSGKALGEGFAWHLDGLHSQLGRARDLVTFADPRTRIAHVDTGYYPSNKTTPRFVRRDLQRSFVEGEDPGSAVDPDNRRLLFDNSGHGTGTLSILAGGPVDDQEGRVMGGAPDAEVVPLRVADSVVLFWTSSVARALHYAVDQGCDVLTMSMGGLPSRAWREAVDRAYLSGLCMVAAAGNNVHGVPTRYLVYPARYGRVIAVCGVMANHMPYTDLTGAKTIEGNYGPSSRMKAAMAAFTPNIPWAVFGCERAVRLNGEGTSAATPQVAAAVALWFERYKGDLSRDWRRVEAVRHALFSTALASGEKLGNGLLQVDTALGVRPQLGLPQTPSDDDSFAFFRVLTGLGVAEAPAREQMFNLELAQRWMVNPRLQELVPDPEAAGRLERDVLRRVMEAVIDDAGASQTLKQHLVSRYSAVVGTPAPLPLPSPTPGPAAVATAVPAPPALRSPVYRRLRVYALDPSLSQQYETAGISEVVLRVRWEEVKPGPVGEYLRVDEAPGVQGVDLDDRRLLAQDGWALAEGNPHFHQQMVYAVAMKTIEHFEGALGRPVLWRAQPNPKRPDDDSRFTRQLTVRPHAFEDGNAFYSPQEVALQFGYFTVAGDDPSHLVPGSRVYTCLSHDIIAHETTHAVLDGMYRRFSEPSNPDVLAFHEAFADIVALLQHFTMPEILEHEIGKTRGDLALESLLGQLAIQFGQASGGRGALRNAIGRFEHGVWTRALPDAGLLRRTVTPHARGAILVAAVFDAFLTIYASRAADLRRIATGGTGVLPAGAIHPDLVRRLADEAVKSATHVLTMCIRALDYLPPVDVTFFEFLRALITADFDIVRDDRLNYRVAFTEVFRRRGIYPVNLDAPTSDTAQTLSPDTLRWQGLEQTRRHREYPRLVALLKRYAAACAYLRDRSRLFSTTRVWRIRLHEHLAGTFRQAPEFARELGLDPGAPFEVNELRRVSRVGADGDHLSQVIVMLTQSTRIEAAADGTPAHQFRGGSTLVVNLTTADLTYRIVKRIDSDTRRARTAEFARANAADPLRALLFGRRGEPFRALHVLADDVG